METQKAGCVLLNAQSKSVGLIYRDYRNDYSFPKGHVEEGETHLETAIRETAEETKREAAVFEEIEPYIEHYTTPSGEACVCYMYLAADMGPSDNDSTDTHDLIWTPLDEVENKLSYPSLKLVWNHFKDIIYSMYEEI